MTITKRLLTIFLFILIFFGNAITAGAVTAAEHNQESINKATRNMKDKPKELLDTYIKGDKLVVVLRECSEELKQKYLDITKYDNYVTFVEPEYSDLDIFMYKYYGNEMVFYTYVTDCYWDYENNCVMVCVEARRGDKIDMPKWLYEKYHEIPIQFICTLKDGKTYDPRKIERFPLEINIVPPKIPSIPGMSYIMLIGSICIIFALLIKSIVKKKSFLRYFDIYSN